VIHDVEHHLFGHSVPVCGVGSLPKETDYAPVAKDYCMDGTGWSMGQQQGSPPEDSALVVCGRGHQG
jgi:hypothetical protein